MEKPTLPKGTRDFGPAVMAKRQFILNTIRTVFQKYGFQPLETPAMENLSTLTGKYGDEGDQLLFKVLDSGDYFQKLWNQELESIKVFFQKLLEEYAHFFKEFEESKEKEPKESVSYQEVLENFIPSIRYTTNVESLIIEPWKQNEIKWYLTINKLPLSDNLLPEYFDIDNNFSVFEEIIQGLTSHIVSKHPSKSLSSKISEKGLRYDLTVPFARFVVMNRNDISFPFKRYQIQPVWRADRPQKGRYREFYQCDADVVGTQSLICEAEIILMIKEVMKGLNFSDYTIKINHRGVLMGLAEVLDAKGKETDLFVAIDKLDKAGKDKVKEELVTKGFTDAQVEKLYTFLDPKGSNSGTLTFLKNTFSASTEGQKGTEDLSEVLSLLKNYNATDEHVELDLSLARGLSYYTGCIFEVKINNVGIGSVSGGGRYDNLTGNFGLPDVSGVGFSFGVDRLYDALEELNNFPKEATITSTVLICHFDDESMKYGLGVLSALREAGIAAEIYPDQAKLKKQLDFGNKKQIPFTIVIGSEEMKSGNFALKNMESGTQETLNLENLLAKLR